MEDEALLLPNEPDDYTFEDWMLAWQDQCTRYDPLALSPVQTGNTILRLLPFEMVHMPLIVARHEGIKMAPCAGCGRCARSALVWQQHDPIIDLYSRHICTCCHELLRPLLARSALKVAQRAICLLLSGSKTTLSRGVIMHHWRRCEWCRSYREMRAADIIYEDHCYFICCRCIGQLERLGRVMVDYSVQHIFSCVAPLIAGELLPKDVGLYLAVSFLEAHGKWLIAADIV